MTCFVLWVTSGVQHGVQARSPYLLSLGLTVEIDPSDYCLKIIRHILCGQVILTTCLLRNLEAEVVSAITIDVAIVPITLKL